MDQIPDEIPHRTRHGNRDSNFSIPVFRNPKNALLPDKRSVKPETPGPIYTHQFRQFVRDHPLFHHDQTTEREHPIDAELPHRRVQPYPHPQ